MKTQVIISHLSDVVWDLCLTALSRPAGPFTSRTRNCKRCPTPHNFATSHPSTAKLQIGKSLSQHSNRCLKSSRKGSSQLRRRILLPVLGKVFVKFSELSYQLLYIKLSFSKHKLPPRKCSNIRKVCLFLLKYGFKVLYTPLFRGERELHVFVYKFPEMLCWPWWGS